MSSTCETSVSDFAPHESSKISYVRSDDLSIFSLQKVGSNKIHGGVLIKYIISLVIRDFVFLAAFYEV